MGRWQTILESHGAFLNCSFVGNDYPGLLENSGALIFTKVGPWLRSRPPVSPQVAPNWPKYVPVDPVYDFVLSCLALQVCCFQVISIAPNPIHSQSNSLPLAIISKPICSHSQSFPIPLAPTPNHPQSQSTAVSSMPNLTNSRPHPLPIPNPVHFQRDRCGVMMKSCSRHCWFSVGFYITITKTQRNLVDS